MLIAGGKPRQLNYSKSRPASGPLYRLNCDLTGLPYVQWTRTVSVAVGAAPVPSLIGTKTSPESGFFAPVEKSRGLHFRAGTMAD